MAGLIFYIILAIIAATLFILLYKIFKSALKAAVTILVIALIIICAVGIIIYIDTGKIAESVSGKKEILLREEETMISGATLTSEKLDISQGLKQEIFKYYTKQELNDAERNYKEIISKEDEKAIIIIFNKDYLIRGQNLSIQETQTVLEEKDLSEIFEKNTVEEIKEILLEKSEMSENRKKIVDSQFGLIYKDVNHLKAELMIRIITQRYSEEKLSLIIEGYSNKETEVYPKFVSLSLIRMMPKKIASIFY